MVHGARQSAMPALVHGLLANAFCAIDWRITKSMSFGRTPRRPAPSRPVVGFCCIGRAWPQWTRRANARMGGWSDRSAHSTFRAARRDGFERTIVPILRGPRVPTTREAPLAANFTPRLFERVLVSTWSSVIRAASRRRLACAAAPCDVSRALLEVSRNTVRRYFAERLRRARELRC
jgi:hypothetical protein